MKHQPSNLIIAAVALNTLFVVPALAGDPAKDGGTCRGQDMLAELGHRNPLAYARIEDAEQKTENADAVLWKVTKPGIAPSYLFGTVHLTDERVTTLSDAVTTALESSSVLALEVADLSPSAMAQAIGGAAKLAIFDDGRSLEKILTPENYAKVESTLQRAGMPVATARLFRPWVVTMLLASSDCERKKLQAGHQVLDMRLASLAKARSIPLVGLETLDRQLAAMASLPEDQQLAMLRAGLYHADRTNDLVETLLQLYLQRRLGATWPFQIALAEEAGIGEEAFSAFKERLIAARNQHMLSTALPLVEKGGAFVAVGALHLSGSSGLVARLRQSGFTVTAVE